MYKFKDVPREVVANCAMGIAPIRAARTRKAGRNTYDVDTQARQVRDQFAFFMGVLRDVRGKVIAEIGPGHAIGLAALFLQAGAARYIAFDRFAVHPFSDYSKQLYDALGCAPDPGRIEVRPAIEDSSPAPEADVVISFDVIEHLAEPKRAVDKMTRLLKPNGIMVHRVDYSAHDVWRSYANGLAFLTIPDWLWRLMGSNRGYPNRWRHFEISHHLRALGFTVDERVTESFSREQLQSARPHLSSRFRQMPDEALLPMVVEFTCAKGRKVPLGPRFPY